MVVSNLLFSPRSLNPRPTKGEGPVLATRGWSEERKGNRRSSIAKKSQAFGFLLITVNHDFCLLLLLTR